MQEIIAMEDNFEDVLMKAARGLGLGKSKLSEATGLPTSAVTSLLRGQLDVDALRKVAPALGLNAAALLALAQGNSAPEVVEVEGLVSFNTPFPVPGYLEMTVNSYLVWQPGHKTAVAFDIGTDCGPLLERVAAEQLNLEAVFLTHTHRDHVADYNALKKGAPEVAVYAPQREPFAGAYAVRGGDVFEWGSLQVEARSTAGHSVGGTSYRVTGLERPLVAVGDALFAGSQGGVPEVVYASALETNRSQLFSMTGKTVVLPGHGPLTTIDHESQWNPFYAVS
jgi:glyoxylase-like metal-dependent hydrolase (beta-lactamase superfamily II)